MASRGAPVMSLLNSGLVSDGGRRMETAPPCIGTWRKNVEIRGPAGMCWIQGSSASASRHAGTRIGAARTNARARVLPDFNGHLLRTHIVGNVFGRHVNG